MIPSLPFLVSPRVEQIGILAPPIVITLLVLLLYTPYAQETRSALPSWMWFVFVVGIDVAHVWSTLFRTYCNRVAKEIFRAHLIIIPLLAWVVGVLLYSIGAATFWTVFAYIAVFHFVRQQYGFFAIYARKVRYSTIWNRRLDTAVIYLAALYPLAYWHLHLPRNITWFMEGDFIVPVSPSVCAVIGWSFIILLSAQVIIELILYKNGERHRIQKNLVIWGTVVAWYVGIVHFNADIPFTLTNVVAHGVPYITLIWVFGMREAGAFDHGPHRPCSLDERIFTKSTALKRLVGVGIFLGVLFLLAYTEELLWDSLVWRDQRAIFSWAWHIPQITSPELLQLVVPLLAVPQATHYILDGFIWRLRKRSSEDRKALLV